MEKWNVEVTDTYGGDANYSWVRRYVIEAPDNASRRALLRLAKRAAGYTGVKGETSSMGEGFEFRPRRYCVIVFITPEV